MKDPRFPKLVVFVNSLVPLVMLSWDFSQDQLGVNWREKVIHTTGMLGLIFLILSLAVTPVRLISGWNWLIHFRRMLGLFAFFYGLMHLSMYFVLQRSMSFSGILEDTLKRKFIFFGMAGLLLMVPLAATSTNGMIKRLGAAKWKRLHQLAYLSAISGMIHYYSSSKVTSGVQVGFVVVLTLLLSYRILVPWLPFLKRRRVVAAPVS